MDCEYCNKYFKTNHILNVHQKTAKYCLKLQGKTVEMIGTKYCCDICGKLSTVKYAYDKHMLRCLNTPAGQMISKLRRDNDLICNGKDAIINSLRTDTYSQGGMIALMQDKIDRQEAKIITMENALIDMNVLQKEVAIYKSQAKESKDCIEQIAKQPKMTATTNILNMHTLDLTDDRVKNIIDEYYNLDYLLAGSKGVAQFTVDKVLTKPDDKIIYSLTDRSREAYNFKNVEGVVEKDTKGRKLREVVYKNGIKEKAFLIANTMILEDPVKADELRCIEYALEVADLDPSTIRTKEANDKVEHAYCKELRETAC
jgi:hypothetical protein